MDGTAMIATVSIININYGISIIGGTGERLGKLSTPYISITILNEK